MRRLRHFLLALCAILILVRPGNGCSFEDDDGSPSRTDPDKPYASFVAGKIGIVSNEFRIRHMVVAYNTLSGRGLTPGEQKAAIAVDQFYNFGDSTPQSDVRITNPDTAQWFGPVTGQDATTISPVERKVPGDDYQTFTNCLADAFTRASATLADRRKRYGADSPEIADWTAAQKAVFSNCSDKGRMPSPAPANAPLWLKQDRAYQIAAAQFYALDYDAALASFRAIAADKTSPWAPLSRYIAARVLIRRATVLYRFDAKSGAEDNNAMTLRRLAEARDQLQSLLRDPTMSQFDTPARHLLDYVMVRLDPATQVEELARRLEQPPNPKASGALDPDYRQNVIDLTYAYNTLPFYSPAAKGTSPVKPQAPLLRWINDLSVPRTANEGLTVNSVYDQDEADHRRDALASWRATHQPQWLAAALSIATPGSDGVADMTTAARNLTPTSPAYATATYHRLRLEIASKPAAPDRYAELATLMPEIERTQPRTTISLFADLQSSVVPTLDLFLKTSTRVASVSIQDEPGEGYPTRDPSETLSNTTSSAATLCGVDINAPDAGHLDTQTALIFNQRMPLHMLRDAALSPALPGNVRFEIAHMAWTRALLLDDPTTAHALTPYLAQCQPAFKTWLTQYDAAKTVDERRVLGLLAMMRFTSTNPTVDAYRERDFASYNDRENWWCTAGSDAGQPSDSPKPVSFFSQTIVSRDPSVAGIPDPPFVSAADRAAADREIAALEKVGGASDYFARESLAWVNAHPTDPHNADVLGFAMRVIRNACRSDATKELNHQLFDTLHRHFPKSEWATRYTTWE